MTQATASVETNTATHASLDTNRSLTKYVLLGIITLGIYSIWVAARAGSNLNEIASHDGKRSMNYWLVALLVGPITLGIAVIVWWHKTSNRIGDTQQHRGLERTISATDFWLWNVLGSLIIVGPFIFYHKWLHAMNGLCTDYNAKG